MTLAIKYAKRAERDLIEIWKYIALDNPGAADALLLRIEDRCQLLTQFPGMGQPRNDLRKGLHHFPVGNYLILYRANETPLTVVRVVHGARIYSAHE